MNVTRGIRIPIIDLGCGGAGATTVERELARTDGVLRVYVNPAAEVAFVLYDVTRTDAWALTQAVVRAGYRPGRPVAEDAAPTR